MKPISHNVLQDFSKYEQLLFGEKMTEAPDIHVTAFKPSNARWRVNYKDLEHAAFPRDASELHTEVQCEDPKNFKFLLFVRGFMPGPLVNYDSGGLAHRNRYSGLPLPEQNITTPHFNRYDDAGRSFAYKTPALRDPAAVAELANVGNCIIHFYDEFNIQHSPAGYPAVYIASASPGQLFDIPTNDDPLADVPNF